MTRNTSFVWTVPLLAACLTAGCLQRDIAETWYLAPDGAVAVVIQESNVRSDVDSQSARQTEEAEYMAAVEHEDHPAAMGFRALGLTALRTRVLRRDVPFSVVTDARASRIDQLGQALVSGLGVDGGSTLERSGDIYRWTLTMRDRPGGAEEPDVDLGPMAGGLAHVKVVLESGRFESATGFTLSSDGRVAECTAFDDALNGDASPASVMLSLTWKP
jgi:hypothetical protein